jgi:hypothetical protein
MYYRTLVGMVGVLVAACPTQPVTVAAPVVVAEPTATWFVRGASGIEIPQPLPPPDEWALQDVGAFDPIAFAVRVGSPSDLLTLTDGNGGAVRSVGRLFESGDGWVFRLEPLDPLPESGWLLTLHDGARERLLRIRR